MFKFNCFNLPTACWLVDVTGNTLTMTFAQLQPDSYVMMMALECESTLTRTQLPANATQHPREGAKYSPLSSSEIHSAAAPTTTLVEEGISRQTPSSSEILFPAEQDP